MLNVSCTFRHSVFFCLHFLPWGKIFPNKYREGGKQIKQQQQQQHTHTHFCLTAKKKKNDLDKGNF